MIRRLGPAFALLVALAGRVAGAAPPVGVSTIVFDTTDVRTHAPRSLATVVWYPAVPHTGSTDPLGLRDARVRHGHHPLVLFLHGACGRPTEATYFTSALARAGFVVAAPPHPGLTADDATCVTVDALVDAAANAVPDAATVIDGMLAASADPRSPFAHRLRPRAIGVTGLSYGGYATLRVAQGEPRVGAAIAMVPGGTNALAPGDIAIPTLVIGAEHDVIVGYAESEHAFARLAGPRFLVELLAANHLSVVDDCFDQKLGVSLCVPTDIPQDEAHRLVLHYAIPFVDRYLLGRRAAGRVLTRQIDGVKLQADPRP